MDSPLETKPLHPGLGGSSLEDAGKRKCVGFHA